MRKEDHMRRVMNLYKEVEETSDGLETRISRLTNKPAHSWEELVEFAADQGMENLELQELIRMADLAKEILRSPAY